MFDKNKLVYFVKDINSYIKAVIDGDENLKYIQVRGELSNVKKSSNGHFYFSLKDEESIINCVIFSTNASKLTNIPENGQEVIITCSVDLYVPRGQYQLIVFDIYPFGLGSQLCQLDELKKRLFKEGLFDESKKRKINIYPNSIGIITAKGSAAIKDILYNIKRRYPIADIYIFYSSVQGENAIKELKAAFKKSQEFDLDTLIIGRGGGPSEDLSAFNNEELVRLVSKSKMPVISAVGHEIDITLIDLVCDKRASTPTGAAELATVDRREIEQLMDYSINDMRDIIKNKIDTMKNDFNHAYLLYKNSFTSYIENLKWKISSLKESLNALDPKKVLERGYSLTLDDYGNTIKINNLKTGDNIVTLVSEGKLYSKINKKELK